MGQIHLTIKQILFAIWDKKNFGSSHQPITAAWGCKHSQWQIIIRTNTFSIYILQFETKYVHLKFSHQPTTACHHCHCCCKHSQWQLMIWQLSKNEFSFFLILHKINNASGQVDQWTTLATMESFQSKSFHFGSNLIPTLSCQGGKSSSSLTSVNFVYISNDQRPAIRCYATWTSKHLTKLVQFSWATDILSVELIPKRSPINQQPWFLWWKINFSALI